MKHHRHPWRASALVTALGGACIVVWYCYPSHADTVCKSVCSKLWEFVLDRTNRNVESQGSCELHKVIACNAGCPEETKRNDYPLLNDMLRHCPLNSIRRQFAAAAPDLDLTAHLQNKDKELMPFLHLTDCQCDSKPGERHFLSRMWFRLAFHFVSHVCGSFLLCFLCKAPLQQIWLLVLNLFCGISKWDVLAVQIGQVPVMDETGMQRYIMLIGSDSTIKKSFKVRSPANQSAYPSLDKFLHSRMKRLCRGIAERRLDICYKIDQREVRVSIDDARYAAQRLDTLVGKWNYVTKSFIGCTHLFQTTIAIVCHVMCVMCDVWPK